MKKVLVLSILLATYFIIPGINKVEAASNIYEDVKELFSETNIKEMTENYLEVEGETWNATKVEDVTDIYDKDSNHIGYLVIFDEGYIAYNSDMSVLELDTKSYPNFYRSSYSSDKKLMYNSGSFGYDVESITYNPDKAQTYGDYDSNIYFPLYDYYNSSGFQVNSSMVQIPYFKDKFDSSSWGNYEPITFSYFGFESGSALCAMSLMYTIKVNGGVNLTPETTSWKDFRRELYYYVGFDYDVDPFVGPQALVWGINKYLDDTFETKDYVFSSILTIDAYNPAVTLYYNNNASATAEFCLRVGHAQEPYFWLFNVYYDIVMANSTNFYVDSNQVPYMWFDDDIYAFYVVDQKYRNEMFQYFEGNKLLK